MNSIQKAIAKLPLFRFLSGFFLFIYTYSIKRFIVLSIITALVATLILVYPRPTQIPSPSLVGQTLSVAPTPVAFEELTIPYLRARSYESRLGDLTKLSENSLYTSYLTNYDSDGLKINGLLTIPKGTPPPSGWPAVVFVHGYIAPTVYKTTNNYASYVDYLAKAGLVVFKIDLRGHDQSEGEPGGAYYSSDYVIDTLNAYSALKNSAFVDASSIGLWGHSMAGNVVFRSLISHPEIKKVVIWAGAGYTYTDLSQFRINDNSYRPPQANSAQQRRRQELFATHGQFNPDSPFWKLVPATNFLDDVTAKVQLHHAVDDNVVNIGYSRNLIEILGPTDIESELFEYQTGGHNITSPSFGQAMQRTADFLKD